MMLMKVRLISYDYVDDVRRLVLLCFKVSTNSVGGIEWITIRDIKII
jgi:hypothetical protein